MLAVSVITPSRSSRTASYRSRVIARVLAGSCVDRSPFVSLMGSSYPAVDLYVPNPHGRSVAGLAEAPERARIQQVVLPGTAGSPIKRVASTCGTFSGAASHCVSKQPIWLGEAAQP